MDLLSERSKGQDVQELIRQKATLHVNRVTYRPRMPPILKGLFSVKHGETTTSFTDTEACKQLFPSTFGQRNVTFVPHCGDSPVNPMAGRKFRVGVVFSGGPAPGGHNVLTGLFDFMKRRNEESQLIGFLGGPSGIVEKKYIAVHESEVAHFRNLGGFHFLGTGRTKIETDVQLESSLRNCIDLDLDGLVVIGGDDSNTNAGILAEYFKARDCCTCVIGVPKTIDGDLRNDYIEASFGFDSCTRVYSNMVANLSFDAISSLKTYHFVRVMGRDASHITLEVALQTHPNLMFISEEVANKGTTLSDVVEACAKLVVDRANIGKYYGVILVPEGLIGFLPDVKLLIEELNEILAESNNAVDPASFDSSLLTSKSQRVYASLPELIQKQMMVERDPHGNVQMSVIDTERLLGHMVGVRLAERKAAKDYNGKFAWIPHFFGYEGRCGFPTKFDADYCYTLGNTAGALLESGCTGMVASVRNLAAPPHQWTVGGSPFTSMMGIERRKGKNKPVIKKKLVDLLDSPFQTLCTLREEWRLTDDYRVPGPIQHDGTDERNFTLQLEAEGRKRKSMAASEASRKRKATNISSVVPSTSALD